MTDKTTWQWSTKALHWLLFLVVVAAVFAAFIASGYEREAPEKGLYMMFHKSFGLTIFVLMLAWITVRFKYGRPKPIGKSWQINLSRVVHWSIVLLLLGMPIFGLLMSQFYQSPVDVFGLFSIPVVLGENKELGDMIHTLHAGVAAPLLILLLSIHIAGALWHHVIDKDETLKRMRPY